MLFLGAFGALVLWVGLSALWSLSLPRTVLELERDVVYVAGGAALLLLAQRGATAWIAAGLLAAATGVGGYALATRLFPDRFGYDLELGYQLARPLGYWNALGILVAIGILLALGFTDSARWFVRAAAAAALPVLVSTLYFTFSRGSLVALAAGLAVMLTLHPRRLRLAATLCVLAPVSGLAVLLASRSEGLARELAAPEIATQEGHKLAAAIAMLAVVSALVAVAAVRLVARVVLTPRAEQRVRVALLAMAAAVALAALVAAGGPLDLATRAYDSFRAPLPATGGEPQGRLFSVSGNGRADYWRVAVEAYADRPLLGSGAGTYELHWNRERPSAFEARDAHSLYVEALAELGPVGLLLVLAALAAPVLAVPAARRLPFVAATTGAYSAFLVHAALDWDWEMPAVTLAGLGCGAALLVAARRPADARALGHRVRAAGLAIAAVVAAFVFVTYVASSALAASEDGAVEGRYEAAAQHARRASRWTPWASEPWRAVGEAQLALGRVREARESFRRAIAKDPRDWNLWYGLARASDGWVREAALERARALNPRSVEVDSLPNG